MGTTRYRLPNSGTIITDYPIPPSPEWTSSATVNLYTLTTSAASVGGNNTVVASGNSTDQITQRTHAWVSPVFAADAAVAHVKFQTEGEHWLGGVKAVALRIRRVNGDLTEVLDDVLPLTLTNESSTTGWKYWGLDVELAEPVPVQAGDRLFVELGGRCQPGSGGQGLYVAVGQAGVDQAYNPGAGSAGGRPWLDVTTIEPPSAPTALAAVPESDAVALSWTSGAGGGVVTGYRVEVVGGADDLVAGSPHTVTDLDSLTDYTFRVRAEGPGGVSSWVYVDATTLAGADYRVVVRLGDRTWDVLAGDAPDYGPTLPLDFGWDVPDASLGFPAQPDAETCPLTLITATGADMAGVDIGTSMRVSIYTSSSTTARPLATFRGRVSDLEAEPHDLGLSWQLLGVGYTSFDLGAARQVGTGAWPQESGDDRAARVMAEAGMPGWASDPIGTVWEARNPAPTSAADVMRQISDAAVTTDGGAFDPTRRVLVHPITDADGELVSGSPFAGKAVVRRVDALDFLDAGVVNRRTTWRRSKFLDGRWVKIDHPGGPTTYGDTRGPGYPAQSVAITDPAELARMVLDTTPGYRWLTGQPLRLELWADDANLAIVRQWFYRDPDSSPFPWSGRAVVIQRAVQTPDGSTTYAGMLCGARLRLEYVKGQGGRLVVTFRLRPDIPADSTVTMRWMDEPAGATWADELADDPTGTWYDYYTTPRP